MLGASLTDVGFSCFSCTSHSSSKVAWESKPSRSFFASSTSMSSSACMASGSVPWRINLVTPMQRACILSISTPTHAALSRWRSQAPMVSQIFVHTLWALHT